MSFLDGVTITISILTSLFVIIFPIQSYADEPVIEWDFQLHYFMDGLTGSYPNFFTITDPEANLDPETVDTVTATVQSIDLHNKVLDTIEITLSEENPFEQGVPDPNSGVFRPKNIVFAPAGWSSFDVNRKIVLIQEDPENYFGRNNGHTPEIVDVTPIIWSVWTSSTLDTYGTSFSLTETGPDTHVYTAKVGFSTISNDFDNGIILAKPGDMITALNAWTGTGANGLVSPNPDPSVGAIYVPGDNYLAVIYKGFPCPIDPDNPPYCDTFVSAIGDSGGVGSGGPVLASPRIVLDIVATLLPSKVGGGGSTDRSPPSLHFTGTKNSQEGFGGILASNQLIDYPLIINGKLYNLPAYSNTFDPIQLYTGSQVDLSLEFLESSKVEHIALHFVDENKDELSDTDPRIIFDKGNVEKSDPDGILGDDITFSASRDGVRSKFNLGFSFNEPTKRHLMITAWDEYRNSENTKIFDAFEVSGQPVPIEENHFFFQDLGQSYISEKGIASIGSQSSFEQQVPILGYEFPDSVGKIDRHDMKVLYDEISNEKIRAMDLLDNNFNLNEKTVATNDETNKEKNIDRAPQLSWSNVGHKLRDFTKTSLENSEVIKNACQKEHLRAEKKLDSILVGSKYHQY